MKSNIKKQKVLKSLSFGEGFRVRSVGGSLRVGLSTASPRAYAPPARLWAFRCNPCRSVVVVMMFWFTIQTHAQVISLDSVLQLIDKQNPMLQEYDSKVKALNTYSEGAKSWMAPMVGVGTFMTPYPGQTIMEDRDKGSIMVSLEQNIPNPARLNANKKYLTSRASVEAEGRSYQYNELRAEAKILYYQWMVAEEKLKVLYENDRIVELMLKLARLRYPYNQGSLGNIYKVEGRLSEVQNMILMTQGDIDEKQYRLKTLMNLPPTTTIMVDTTTRVHGVSSQVVYDTAALSTQRSDVRQIDKTIQVMQLNQQLQRYQAKPDFKIRFDHMQPIGDMPTQFTAMAMVSIPIAPWSSKMYKSEVKGMQYDIEAMKKGREALLIETRGMLAGMAVKIDRMQQQLVNYNTKIIPALRKNYETLMLSYEENREQLPIVIDGWEALNMAQLEYLNKMDEYYTMIANYERELEK
ncbi:MAG: TolC family protein [Cyclobacteriaceae bacterium]|nr:TolC family protein [Cyclobacteriaceae bacterium]